MAIATRTTILRFPFAEGIELRLRPGVDIAERAGFEALCEDNPDMRIQRSGRGELTIEMPTKGFTGACNSLLAILLGVWALANGQGLTFDSSTGFDLPEGSTLSPDAAWVRKERLEVLTSEQKKSFLPITPDFIAELRSDSDRLSPLQAKMVDWQSNGVRLGLLLDPANRKVHVYRLGNEPQILDDPTTIDCSPELPGFLLDVTAIFDVTL